MNYDLYSPLTPTTLLLQMTLFSTMMRDQRINVREPLLSADPMGNRRRLRDQLAIYSFQYKTASNAFSKGRVSLNGIFLLSNVFCTHLTHTHTQVRSVE